jgi:hypothetical protein
MAQHHRGRSFNIIAGALAVLWLARLSGTPGARVVQDVVESDRSSLAKLSLKKD